MLLTELLIVIRWQGTQLVMMLESFVIVFLIYPRGLWMLSKQRKIERSEKREVRREKREEREKRNTISQEGICRSGVHSIAATYSGMHKSSTLKRYTCI